MEATDETPMHTERKSGSVTPRRQGAKENSFCGFAALRELPILSAFVHLVHSVVASQKAFHLASKGVNRR